MGLSESEIFGWPELKIEERKKKYRLLKKQAEAMGQNYVIQERIKHYDEIGKAINSYLDTFDKMLTENLQSAQALAEAVSSQIDFIQKEKGKAEKRVKNALVVDKENPANKKAEKDYEAIRAQLIIAVDLFSKSSRQQQDKDGKSKTAALAETIRANLNELDTEDAKKALKKAGKTLSKEFRSQANEAVVIGETIRKGLESLNMRLTVSMKHAENTLSQKEREDSIVAIAMMQSVEPSAVLDIESDELKMLHEEQKKIDDRKKAASAKKNKNDQIEKTMLKNEQSVEMRTLRSHSPRSNNG